MNSNKKEIIIHNRDSLVKNLILIDGVSRSGKFLLGNIMGGLENIEPTQYYESIEQIPYLERFGFINKKVAQEMLKCEIDIHCNKMLLGRNFNYRKSDKSYIFNNPNHEKYLKRCETKDKEVALDEFYQKKPYTPFITHEIIPYIKIFLDTFPKIKIINIQRNMVDLVYSHYTQNASYREKFKRDHILLAVMLKEGNISIPRYTSIKYEETKNPTQLMDKIIISMEDFFLKSQIAYNKLSIEEKEKILFINYEDILENTIEAINKISNFLGAKVLPEMEQIFKREKLPDKSYNSLHEDKIKKIKAIATKEYFNRIMKLNKKTIYK